jgi:hypothetical protein
MGKKNMDELVDELLFDKKKSNRMPLKESEIDIKKILEQDDDKKGKESKRALDAIKTDDEASEKTSDIEEDIVLEVSLSVDDKEEIKQISNKEYPKRAITDFLSLISLFKDSKDIDVRQFLQSIGVGKAPAPVAPTLAPAPGTEAQPEQPAQLATTEQPETGKLSYFVLSARERLTQAGQTKVSIAGEENVNDMLSFKVSVDDESTAFNTPEQAIAQFNRVFFDNIVKTIDKVLQNRSE